MKLVTQTDKQTEEEEWCKLRNEKVYFVVVAAVTDDDNDDDDDIDDDDADQSGVSRLQTERSDLQHVVLWQVLSDRTWLTGGRWFHLHQRR